MGNTDVSQEPGSQRAAHSPIERLLADARARLIETSTRNRLVHTPRAGKRTRSLPIIGADTDDLFDTLVRSGRVLRFLPASLERELALEIKADYESSVPVADAASNGLQTNLDAQRCRKATAFHLPGCKDRRGRARYQHPFPRDRFLAMVRGRSLRGPTRSSVSPTSSFVEPRSTALDIRTSLPR